MSCKQENRARKKNNHETNKSGYKESQNKKNNKARWTTASVTQTAEKYHDLNLF